MFAATRPLRFRENGWRCLLGTATTLKARAVHPLNPSHGAALLASPMLPNLFEDDREYPKTAQLVRALFERTDDHDLKAKDGLTPELSAELCDVMFRKYRGDSENDGGSEIVDASLDEALRECREDALEPPLAIGVVLAHAWQRASDKGAIWSYVDALRRERPEEFAVSPLPGDSEASFFQALQFDEDAHRSLLTSSVAEACFGDCSVLAYEASVAQVSRLRYQGLSTSAARADDKNDEASRAPPWSLAAGVGRRLHAEALARAWSGKPTSWPLLAALASPAVVEALLEEQRPVPRALFLAAFPPGDAGHLARTSVVAAALRDVSRQTRTVSSSSLQQRGAPSLLSTRGNNTVACSSPTRKKKTTVAKESEPPLHSDPPLHSATQRSFAPALAFAKRVAAKASTTRAQQLVREDVCVAVFANGAASAADDLLFDLLDFATLPSAPTIAAEHDSPRWLRELKARGRDLDEPYENRRPLTAAAARGCVNALRFLLHSEGVAPDAPCDSSLTPLLAASRNGLLEVVDELLAAGADVNRAAPRDSQGHTPLHLALTVQLAQKLIDAGADVRARSAAGHTAYDILPHHITRYLKSNTAIVTTVDDGVAPTTQKRSSPPRNDDDDDDDDDDEDDELDENDDENDDEDDDENDDEDDNEAKESPTKKPRLEATRILTEEDFERIKALKAKAKELALDPRKASGGLVAVSDIEGYSVKRKATIDERRAKVEAGRDKFQHNLHAGGKTNTEKKRNKNYLMLQKKAQQASGSKKRARGPPKQQLKKDKRKRRRL